MQITDEVLHLARKIWDYHHVNHHLRRADCVFTLGSHDPRVALRAVELYKQGWAPLLIFSGGVGRLTQGTFAQSEADLFASIALENGVPASAILTENKSTNTGENIQFTQKLLKERGINPASFILVQKPYMERRTLATFEKNWKGKEFVVTSPQIAFEEYPNDEISMERVIQIMVGDLQRIKVYPVKGFQTFQEIPGDVWGAYEELVSLGFDGELIR